MTSHKPPRALLFANPYCFLAFGGGVGLFPKAPGTAGTILGGLLYYAAAALIPPIELIAVGILLLAVGGIICARANAALNRHDAGCIVWDELAAFFALLSASPAGWQWHAAAFIFFRLLDAAKPFPISWLDKNLKGGWGVMADDIAAAAATLAFLWAAQFSAASIQ